MLMVFLIHVIHSLQSPYFIRNIFRYKLDFLGGTTIYLTLISNWNYEATVFAGQLPIALCPILSSKATGTGIVKDKILD